MLQQKGFLEYNGVMENAEILEKSDITNIIPRLNAGQVGMLPTDTLYGLSCLALNKSAVEKIYRIKKRDDNKPLIVLIDSIESIKDFGISLTKAQKVFLEKNWPNKLTVVLKCNSAQYEYIHRGKNSIGFRLPDDAWLKNLLSETGPLVSTTVNISGEPAINSINEAVKLFGVVIDFYVEAGTLESQPSTIIELDIDGKFTILRQGSSIVYAY